MPAAGNSTMIGCLGVPEAPGAVDQLAGCIEQVLGELPRADTDILRACDLGRQSQAAFAPDHGLTLPAAKSRLLRAVPGCAGNSWRRAACASATTDGCAATAGASGAPPVEAAPSVLLDDPGSPTSPLRSR